MASTWRWFIHPATPISTKRNGSKILGILLPYYRRRQIKECHESAQIQADPVPGPYAVRKHLLKNYLWAILKFLRWPRGDQPSAQKAEVGFQSPGGAVEKVLLSTDNTALSFSARSAAVNGFCI